MNYFISLYTKFLKYKWNRKEAILKVRHELQGETSRDER